MKYDSQSPSIEEREPCIDQIIERLARIETIVDIKFKEIEKAREVSWDQLEKELTLAKEVHDNDRTSSASSLEYKLQTMNNFQRRMEKLEAEFVTNKILNDEVNKLSVKIDSELGKIKQKIDADRKIIHIGIGVAVSFQFLVGIVALILRHLGI
jgi:membrane-bound lytic murein transglycosylase B